MKLKSWHHKTFRYYLFVFLKKINNDKVVLKEFIFSKKKSQKIFYHLPLIYKPLIFNTNKAGYEQVKGAYEDSSE